MSKPKEQLRFWATEGMMPGGGVEKPVGAPAPRAKAAEGIKIIDCDTHFTEWRTLWTERAPAAMKDRVPVIRTIDGMDHWFIGDFNVGHIGASVIGRDGAKLLGKLSHPTIDTHHPGSYSVKERLEVMDDYGIWAQICYPNGGGATHARTLMQLDDPQDGIAILQMYNEAMGEVQHSSAGRLFPQAVLPLWDSQEMLREARRCVEEHRLTGFTLPDRPEQFGIPGFLDAHWRPLFELCNDREVPIDFHLSSGIDGFTFTWSEAPFGNRLAVASTLFSLGNAATLCNFITSGLFDRYPKLRVVSVESGLGWVPYVLEQLTWNVGEMMPGNTLRKTPHEYFRDHFYVCYWFETLGPTKLMEEIGTDNILFETDFPHPTSLYPGVQEHIEKTLGAYDFETRKRVLQDNAAGLYHLPV